MLVPRLRLATPPALRFCIPYVYFLLGEHRRRCTMSWAMSIPAMHVPGDGVLATSLSRNGYRKGTRSPKIVISFTKHLMINMNVEHPSCSFFCKIVATVATFAAVVVGFSSVKE